jgi:hypothetical protein
MQPEAFLEHTHFNSEDGGEHVPPEHHPTLTRLYGITPQKIRIVTAVKIL